MKRTLKQIIVRLPDDQKGQAILEHLNSLPWGTANRFCVDALYAAATGQRQQAAAQPVEVDLAAIRKVVDAAVRTALNGANFQSTASQEEAIRETVDDVLDDLDTDAILF